MPNMKFLFISLVFLTFQLANAQIYDEVTKKPLPQAQDPYGYDAFLKRVSFENFSAGLDQSLNDRNFLNPHISQRVLPYHSKRYLINNYARELANELLSTLHTTNRNPESRDKIIEFAIKLLRTEPVDPPNRLPEEFKSNPEKATEYLMEITRENIEVQSEVVMADLINALYGKKVTDEFLKNMSTQDKETRAAIKHLSYLQKKISHLVQFMYLDNEMGRFSVAALGKALVLGMTRYQVLRDRSGATTSPENNLITRMKKAFKEFNDAGFYYENYVGTTLIVNGEDGERKKVEIKNGDFIFERSFGQQANEIISGARPSGFQNTWQAAKLGLMGLIAGRYLHNTDDSITKDPSLNDRMKKSLRESKIFTNGVSHSGVAEVLKDPETGIETTRSIDAYLDEKEGGIRFTDILHQFANKSEFLRFIVARPDPAKLAKLALKSKNEIGYREIVHMGDKENKDGSVHKENSVPWRIGISEPEYNELNSIAERNPQEFAKITGDNLVLGMKELFYKGTGFAHGFSNSHGRVYCSFAMVLAIQIKMGFDIQPIHDRWNYFVQIAKKFNMAGLERYNMKNRIVAPGGLFWQGKLIDFNDIQVVDYPLLPTEERNLEGFSPRQVAQNSELHRQLRTINEFVKNTQDGAQAAAEKSNTIEEIENIFNAEIANSKFSGDDRPHGRARNSYLAKARALIETAKPRATSQAKVQNQNNSQNSCSKIFLK